MDKKTLVGIVMGSDSDLETMREATKTLERFDISYEVSIISAHRTPQRAYEYASGAEKIEDSKSLSPQLEEQRI